jgi:hypothetical protein
MSIAIAKNHMAEMNMLGMLAVLDQTIADATRDKISYSEFVDCVFHAMPVMDFTACRSNISRDAGPGFHGMSVQDFTSCRPGFHGEPSR